MPVISRKENTRSGVASQTSGSKSGMASMSATVVVPVFEQHVRAAQPGAGVIGITPGGFGGGDGGNPIGEVSWRRQLPGHVGVIQMAMGVDQAGQQDDLAEVEDLLSRVRLKIRPGTDGADSVFGNEDRAVFDGRPGNRQDRSGAENHFAGDK